jgi:small subunit ribosomal protein S20
LANHVSALKRARQSEKRRMRNRMEKGAMRTAIKQVNAAVEAGDKETANAALKSAIPLIDRAGQKGTIHRKTASRSVSRLVARVKALSA